MLRLQSSSKKTKCWWQVGQVAGFEWKWRRTTVHSPWSLSPWLAAAHGGSTNHRYKTTSNEHPPSTIVQQSQDKLWEKLKIWRHHEWRKHGKPALDKYQRRWVDWRTERATGSLHYAPDSPWQFLMFFLKYVLSICCYAIYIGRMARGEGRKKTDAKGRR